MDHKLTAINFERRKDAEFYSCSFGTQARPSGWAILILDEVTGAVSILSDFGNWSGVWPPYAHQRTSLKHFLCEGDFDYMARKLTANHREFDGEATIKEIKKRIIEVRREGSLNKDEARSLWGDLDTSDEGASEESFWSDLNREVCEFLDSDYYQYACHRPTSEFLWLKDGILPAIITELRKVIE